MPRLRAHQPHLPGFDGLKIRSFGGALLGRGNPRGSRPLSVKRPLHLVMRSSRATGPSSLLSPRRTKQVEVIVRGIAKNRGIRVYRFANSGNHLHILLRAPSLSAYRAYIRAISGLIARLVLGTERGAGRKRKEGSLRTPENAQGVQKRKSRFWDARPFTRIVEWGRDYGRVCDYLLQNRLEALGFIPYRFRGKKKKKKEPGRTRAHRPLDQVIRKGKGPRP